ncbi:hypothetical protein ACIQC9_04210 [Brevundimonas sp. NPDC092305]|uniref:hypothetical protein n=1 Tax=Brevundimonas sp. NPDC092305 TaxID=3363957 RepID=UPI003823BC0D
MAEKKAPSVGRLFVQMGVFDAVIGAVLLVLGLAGVLGEGLEVVTILGGVMVLAGAVLFVLGRRKLRQEENLRGDLN